MRKTAAAVLVAACLGCAGPGNDTRLSINGRFCLGDNYEVWSGEEANRRFANCQTPISTATFAVELTDGSRLQADTDGQGHFFLEGIPAADVELLLFDGGIRISGFGPGSVLRIGPNRLFVELPPSFCQLPRDNSDQDQRNQERPLIPPHHAKDEQLTLVDCTAECAARFPNYVEDFGFNPYPHDAVPLQFASLEPSDRRTLIAVASRWALDTCYLPCEFEMCACLLRLPTGMLGAYVAPTDPEPGAIEPEAVVIFDPADFTLVDMIRYHSPCREYAQLINWDRDTCR